MVKHDLCSIVNQLYFRVGLELFDQQTKITPEVNSRIKVNDIRQQKPRRRVMALIYSSVFSFSFLFPSTLVFSPPLLFLTCRASSLLITRKPERKSSRPVTTLQNAR